MMKLEKLANYASGLHEKKTYYLVLAVNKTIVASAVNEQGKAKNSETCGSVVVMNLVNTFNLHSNICNNIF